jgi:chromosome segregation ATPase
MITELEAKKRATQRQIEQLSAPTRAIAAAEAELTALEEQIEAARVAAERDTTMARLTELASAGAQALSDMRQGQAEFDSTILPLLERISEARRRQSTMREAFYRELPRDADLLLTELESAGADLSGVLLTTGGPERSYDRPYDTSHLFSGALATALHEEAHRRGMHLRPNVIIRVLPERKNDDG